MILQALTRYYEDLLSLGLIARDGWAKAKVAYALDIGDDGSLLGLLHLQQEVMRGKKAVLVSQEREVPQPVKRSSGVSPNFLCDTSGYLLGTDAKGNPKRTAACFAASRSLHERLLADVQGGAARAVLAFFSHWDPAAAPQHPALQQEWDDLMKSGGNLLLWYHGAPVSDDPQVWEAWQQAYAQTDTDDAALCLVTGRRGPIARLHPNIKGVVGAQSGGASLVSFNEPAFCSYGHEQGDNAPTGEYAASAYTKALNYLIADQEHMHRTGDTTVVCWAEGGQPAYQDCAMAALYDDTYSERDIQNAIARLARGEAVDWQEQRLDPNTRFYVLGLAPNAARLSVRFFWQNSFGVLAQNVARHHERLKIIHGAGDKRETLSIWRLLRETVNQNARNPQPDPRLAGDLLEAVLNNTRYPATLLNGATLRVRAEHRVTRGRAAILKAWYLRNSQDEQLKEVMTVELNEKSTYLPYVLGRLFSVLEAVQQSANPGINTTIKDRYFNSASATPASVFPLLINLAQKHLAKLEGGLAVYYSKRITELNARITQTLPARLSLAEQSAFQIGYYHETQKRYTKKEEQ